MPLDPVHDIVNPETTEGEQEAVMRPGSAPSATVEESRIIMSAARKSRGIPWLLASLLCVGAVESAAADDPITTIVGTGDDRLVQAGAPTETSVGYPFGVEYGPGNDLYICEVTHHRVWRLDPNRLRLTVVAGTGQKGYSGDGGPATAARLNEPYEVRFDTEGNMVFVEMQNHVVRRVDATTGTISTIAGNGSAGFSGDGGPATQAQLSRPHSIALDADHNLYIADIGNHRIRRVQLRQGTIDTIAGNGQRQLPTDGSLALDHPVVGPRALFVSPGFLWVALREGHSVWRLNLDDTRWRHVAGTGEKGYTGDGGDAKDATFNGPKGIALDSLHNIYIVDTENQVIRFIDARDQLVHTLAGRGPEHRGFSGDLGPATDASLNRPHGICVSADGRRVIIGDSENHRVRQVTRRP